MLFCFVLVSWKIFLKMLPSVFRKAVICWISASKVIVCIQSAWDQKSNVDVHNHIPHSFPCMSCGMTDRDGVEMTTLNACCSFAILWHVLYMFCRICPSYHKHHPRPPATFIGDKGKIKAKGLALLTVQFPAW